MSEQNKIAVITASSKGIGLAVADRLIADGCTVLISSSNENNIRSAAANLSAKFQTKVPYIVCDLHNEEHIESFASRVLDIYGSVDILINNCGGPSAGYFDDFTAEDWYNGHTEILRSAQILSKAFLPGMKSKNFGRIVNITSIAVQNYIDNLVISTTYRAALTAFANVLAHQVAEYGITINTVAPGYTLTERVQALSKKRAAVAGKTVAEIEAGLLNQIPARRFGLPEEIAAAVSFFCSGQASYITGQVLTVDGGYSKVVI
ncbi:MAG: SDR family oxidoreductase [Ignavibacteria bacterium]|nr:SDR family oxidoreductase [Ignavibacteria bacterium]